MSKAVSMTIRIEPELRAVFTEAAARDHRSAAQVLRELMRGYVEHVETKGRGPVDDSVSVMERFERERAVRLSNASVDLEGFKLDPELAVQQKQYVDGDIGLDELLRMNGMAPEPGYPAA